MHNLAGWLCFGLVFVFGLWFGVCLVVVVVVGAVFSCWLWLVVDRLWMAEDLAQS